MNSAVLNGTVVWRDVIRETPAGIAILNLRIHHRSSQTENGLDVPAEIELAAMAAGEVARQLDSIQVDDAISIKGFLSRKSRQNDSPVLHITQFKLS
ncbi:MAG: primosomal replication protein N [Betaproteobacteria bacterium]|nr:primosomal replication protein N [Betaproteobacteria bacterium]